MSDTIQNELIEPLIASGRQLLATGESFFIEATTDETLHHDGFHGLMQDGFDIIIAVIDIVTVVVILYGFLFAIYLFVKMHIDNLFGEKHTSVDLSVIRVKLGSYLLLALELFIAADIILTIGDPTFTHLINLGAIILIRIAISHFLQQEMNELTEGGVHH